MKFSEFTKVKKPEPFIFFWGCGDTTKIQKGCFSQWWPCKFTVNKITYSSAEQYMMAQKAELFGDYEIKDKILKTESPKEIKQLGREVKNFEPGIWNKNKFEIVVKGNTAKFSQNSELKKFLLDTGDAEIVEASPKDKIWGVGLAEQDPRILDKKNWKGQNLLGQALMEVRSMFKTRSGILGESTISTLPAGSNGRFWSRINDNKTKNVGNPDVHHPCFLNRDIGRTKFYLQDKNYDMIRTTHTSLSQLPGYIDIVEISDQMKICDLTNVQDCVEIGLKSAPEIFAEGEPYFVFNMSVVKDKQLIPDSFRSACSNIINALKLEFPKKYNPRNAGLCVDSADKFTEILFDKSTESELESAIDYVAEFSDKLECAYYQTFLEIKKAYTANSSKILNMLHDKEKAATYLDRLQMTLFFMISQKFDGFYCKEKFRDRLDKSQFQNGKYANDAVKLIGTPMFGTLAVWNGKLMETKISLSCKDFFEAKDWVERTYKHDSDIDLEYSRIIEYIEKVQPEIKAKEKEKLEKKIEMQRKKDAEALKMAADMEKQREQMKKDEEMRKAQVEQQRLDSQKKLIDQWLSEMKPKLWGVYCSSSKKYGYMILVLAPTKDIAERAVNILLNSRRQGGMVFLDNGENLFAPSDVKDLTTIFQNQMGGDYSRIIQRSVIPGLEYNQSGNPPWSYDHMKLANDIGDTIVLTPIRNDWKVVKDAPKVKFKKI